LTSYYTHGDPSGKFRGFHPKALIKAFKLANDNEWVEKATQTFRLVVGCVGLHGTEKIENMMKQVKLAIAEKKKLNFEHLNQFLMCLYQRKYVNCAGALYVFDSLTDRKFLFALTKFDQNLQLNWRSPYIFFPRIARQCRSGEKRIILLAD
jgi:hypothetical protein